MNPRLALLLIRIVLALAALVVVAMLTWLLTMIARAPDPRGPAAILLGSIALLLALDWADRRDRA